MIDIDFDEIRKEVAIKHNVLLGADDPILVTVTINELVIRNYLNLLAQQNEEAQRSLAIALQHHVEQSKETAGKVITNSADYVSQQVRQSVTAALADAGVQLRHQVSEAQAATRESAASLRDAQVAKSGAVIAAIVAGVSAVVAIGALVVVLAK
jgi:hypothetical protein